MGNLIDKGILIASGTEQAESKSYFKYENDILTLGSPITPTGVFPSSDDYVLSIDRETDETLTTNAHGYEDRTRFIRTANGYANNSFNDASQIIGTATYDHHASFQSQFEMNGSGILTTSYGFTDIFKSNSGITATRYGTYIFNATGGGSVLNQYGHYVPTLSKGSVSNWAFYAETNDSFLGGDLTVGSVSGKQLNIRPNFAGSGALPAGMFVNNNGNGSWSIVPSSSGTAGNKLVFGYFNGTAFRSAIEFGNVASGETTLYLGKNGAKINIGNIPTSAAGLSSGDLWSNAGVINIIP